MRRFCAFVIVVVLAIATAGTAGAQVCTGWNCGLGPSGEKCFCNACAYTPQPAACGGTGLVCPLLEPVSSNTLVQCCSWPTPSQQAAACQAAGMQGDGQLGSPCGQTPVPNCPGAQQSHAWIGCPAVANGPATGGCAGGLTCSSAVNGGVGVVGHCVAPRQSAMQGQGLLGTVGAWLTAAVDSLRVALGLSA
jgi:hypothetical protein